MSEDREKYKTETANGQSKLSDLLCVTVADGKYTVIMPANGGLKALRYGEEWRDCCGDGLIYALAAEIAELREKNA